MRNRLERVQTAARNLRSAHAWRPADMVNWHRLVRPLRDLSNEEYELDFYRLAYHLCTRLAIDYRPHAMWPEAEGQAAGEPEASEAMARGPHVALFVDAPSHVSGVATTIREWSREAEKRNRSLRLLCAGQCPCLPGAVCFPAVGTLVLDAYEGLNLHVPRVTDVLGYVQSRPVDVIHVSTPGPMGLLGLLAGHMLNVPVCGTYHTDFPRYATRLAGDPTLEVITWQFMRWFYGSMDRVAAPSPATRDDLIGQGIFADAIRVVGRGVDRERFSPGWRDDILRAKWGMQYPFKLLYVGRVSKEKNLSCLVEAYKMLKRVRHDVSLVVVGDGPYLNEMAGALAGLPVVFTGFEDGEMLSRIYASADLFVFPSETDTLGVVILEAQASGLPAIVAEAGGPKHCIRPDVTGRVLKEMNPVGLCSAIDELLSDSERLAEMSEAARAHSESFTHARSFEAFWALHDFDHAQGDTAAVAAGRAQRAFVSEF